VNASSKSCRAHHQPKVAKQRRAKTRTHAQTAGREDAGAVDVGQRVEEVAVSEEGLLAACGQHSATRASVHSGGGAARGRRTGRRRTTGGAWRQAGRRGSRSTLRTPEARAHPPLPGTCTECSRLPHIGPREESRRGGERSARRDGQGRGREERERERKDAHLGRSRQLRAVRGDWPAGCAR
jgi:hypothetical protein